MKKIRPSTALVFGALLAAALPAAAGPRVLALGDSYTIGEGVQPNQRWPNEMCRLLRRENIPAEEPVVIAKTGWTASDLSQAIDRAKVEGSFDVVTLMVGVNDQFRGGTPEAFRKDFTAVLGKAIKIAGEPGKVVVLSIPDYGATPFGAKRDPKKIADSISKFNMVVLDETRKAGARYVNVTAVGRYAAKNRTLTADDGLHPSSKLHAVWARLVYTTVRPLLANRLR